MTEILARCGYRCDLCPGYAGNIHNDKDRQAASDGWNKYAGFRLRLEDINCPGCSGNNVTLDRECTVRPCVMQKGFDNCGDCAEMPCDKLKTRMNFVEERLRALPDVPKADYNKFLKPYESKDRLIKIRANSKRGKD